MNSDDDLDGAFAALSDRTRRAIIARLAHGEATVGELADLFPLTHQAVSRHVGILRTHGFILQRVDGQRRPCRLNPDRPRELIEWLVLHGPREPDRPVADLAVEKQAEVHVTPPEHEPSETPATLW